MQEELLNPPKRRARPVADTGQPVRDGNVELITMMLESLEKEHEFLCALNPETCHLPRPTVIVVLAS